MRTVARPIYNSVVNDVSTSNSSGINGASDSAAPPPGPTNGGGNGAGNGGGRPGFNPDAPPSKRFAVTAILITLALLVSMLGLLLYRAVTQRAPSAVLIVQGDPHWDGAQLLITPVGAATPAQPHLTGTLSRANKYAITFFLNPGQYELRVMTDVRELWRTPFTLTARQPQLGIDLTKTKVPPPHPTTDEWKE